MARPSNKAQRREEIVQGMMRAMSVHGYQGATISKIAQEAGLRSGLVHYHFTDKQAILMATLEQIRDAMQARYDVALAHYQKTRPQGGFLAWNALDAYIDAHLSLQPHEPEQDMLRLRCWVIIGAQALHQEQVRAHYETILSEDMDMLRTLARLAAPKLDPSARARACALLYASISGAYQLGALERDLVPRGDAAAGVRALARALMQQEAP